MTQIESRGLLTSNWAYGLCYPGAYSGEAQEARRWSPQASGRQIRKGQWRSQHSSSKEIVTLVFSSYGDTALVINKLVRLNTLFVWPTVETTIDLVFPETLSPSSMDIAEVTPRQQSPRKFQFEIGWLQRDGFHNMVKEIWERPVAGLNLIQRWNN
jgi:hypothetical protein